MSTKAAMMALYLAGSMILPLRLLQLTIGAGTPTVKHGIKTSAFHGVAIKLPKDMIPAGTTNTEEKRETFLKHIEKEKHIFRHLSM